MQPVKLPNDGIMNAGTIKIGKSGEIIFQFKNYHHIIDGETELYYAHMVERKINELNQALQKANEENERLKKLMSADVIKIETPTDGKFELPEIDIRPGAVKPFVDTKADVDKAIADKDAEINNLKKQLQDKENDIENVKESINIKIDKNEVETLVKVLEDYKEVLLNRMAKEANNGRFSNVNGKRNFIYKFIIPLKLKLLESLNKENG